MGIPGGLDVHIAYLHFRKTENTEAIKISI